MPKTPETIANYIAAQPESEQPALREIHAMIAQAFPQAKAELYGTAKGDIAIYKEGDTWRGGFSVRAKGPMVYLIDTEVVANHKPQLGSLAAGNSACVVYKPTKSLDAAALKSLFAAMLNEAAAKRK